MTSREERLRARSAAVIVDQLNLSSSPDWHSILERIEARLGKAIRLVPVEDAAWEAVTALLLESETEALILYPTAAPPIYQQHSVFHEFGHMLSEEMDCGILDIIPRDLIEAAGIKEAIVKSAARGLEIGEHELMAEAVAYALARKLINSSPGREGVFGL